jgi:DHA2 family multidrug resistance protein
VQTRSKYAIALTAALGLFMAVLDNTVVNVALTPMATALKTGLQSIQWVVTGYFLAQAAVIPVAGYFSNRFGIKRLFILCLAAFTAGSLLCGLAQNEAMLIGFRVLQGLGGGALFPLTQALAFGAFPPRERAAASAVVGIPVLLAPAFGPTVGGLLTDNFGWEWIFFINVPVGIIAVALAWWIIPADQPHAAEGRRFDYVGLVLSIAGVLAIVYAFTLVSQVQAGTETAFNPRGTINGWGYWPVWAFLAAGVAILAAFAFYELRHEDPVLDLRIYTRRDFTVGSLITWVASIVIFGSIFLIPVFLEQVRQPHLSALDAGLALMPQGIAAAIAVALGGRFLYDRLGVRYMVVLGSIPLIASSWALSQLTPTSDGGTLLPWLILRGFGFGLTTIPVQTLAMQAITGAALPKASSLFTVTRQMFSSIGIAILTTLFVQQTAQHADTLRATLTAQLPPGVTPDPNSPLFLAARDHLLAQAGTAGLNDVFWLVTIGTGGILLLAWALPSRHQQAAAHAQHPADGSQSAVLLAD